MKKYNINKQSTTISQTTPKKEEQSKTQIEMLFELIGLSNKEANVYMSLLSIGKARVARISSTTKLQRTHVYQILDRLHSHNLVQKLEQGGVAYFSPQPPHVLIDLIESYKKSINTAEAMTNHLIPDLQRQWKEAVGKPVVKYYFGKEGVEKVFDDVYASGKDEIVGCVGWEKPDPEVFGKVLKKYGPLRIRRKIFTRALNSDSPEGKELKKKAKKSLSEIFLADKEKYPLPAEIDVYEDKIAFMSFADHDFVGVVLENKDFATTLNSVFKLLFEKMRESKKNS